MTTTAEPERELLRRLLPFSLPAVAIAVVAGAVLGGAGAGVSAGIAVAAVAINLILSATCVAWAARISPIVLMAVGLGGFVVRLATFTVTLLLLDRVGWFSPIAFAAAFVPATVALLTVEMKFFGGRMQADLWYFREAGR